MQSLYLVLADAILISHALIVLFNVASLVLILLGRFFHWLFVRNFYFRTVHLLLIGYIALQAMLGQGCSLTDWENELRIKVGFQVYYVGSFIAY